MLLTITSLTEEGGPEDSMEPDRGPEFQAEGICAKEPRWKRAGSAWEQKEACGGSRAVSEDEHDPRGQEEGLEGRGSSGRVG